MLTKKHLLLTLILIISDIGLLYLSLALALLIRNSELTDRLWQLHWPIFTWLFFIWLVIFYALDFYELKITTSVIKHFNNVLKGAVINILFGVLFFYIFKGSTEITPKTILLLTMTVFVILHFIWRRLAKNLLNKKYGNFNRSLFIGYSPLVADILSISQSPMWGFKFIGLVDDTTQNSDLNLPIYQYNQLDKIIDEKKINTLIVAGQPNQNLLNKTFSLLSKRLNLLNIDDLYELVFQKIPNNHISQAWFLKNLATGNRKFYELGKRIFDIVISLALLIIALPFIPFIILMVKLSSPGPILFKQIRLGRDGRNFLAIKFRTWRTGHEKSGPQLAQKDDPRITKIGKLLRKIRIDEIPQLINILKGEMSFIGPRPERPELVAEFEHKILFYRQRLLIKPGLTGWAQINLDYADSADSIQKLQYDLYYIKNRSIALDLKILLKTLNTILSGKGQ